jgi:excisionase family DNA binding protein
MFDTTAANSTFSVPAAAERLGVAEITLRRMVARREIGFLRLGSRRGRIVFYESHLMEYLERRNSPPLAA